MLLFLPRLLRRGFARLRRRVRSPQAVSRPSRAGGASVAAAGEPRLFGGLPQREATDLLWVLAHLAESLLSSGSPVADVTRSVLRAARGAGLRGVQVDITYTAVTVCAVREDGVPLTALRVIRARDADYARLSHLYALARGAARGMPRATVAARLAEVLEAAPERSRAVRAGAVPLLAACVALLAGAGAALALAAALASGVVLVVRGACTRVDLPPFFVQAAGAAAATAVAVGLVQLPQDLPGVGPLAPAVVVGPGIVVLLAGFSLVEAAQDALAGYYVTGGARAFEALVMSTGLVVGIGAVLSVAQQAGAALALPVTGVQPGAGVGVLAGGVAAAAQGLSRDGGRRAVGLAGVVGAAAWLVDHAMRATGAGTLASVGAAAVTVGAAAQLLGPLLSSPPVVVSICGIVPLLPGLAIYRGIAALVAQGTAVGLTQLVTAAATALALAAGTTLGMWATASPGARQWTGTGGRRRSLPRDSDRSGGVLR